MRARASASCFDLVVCRQRQYESAAAAADASKMRPICIPQQALPAICEAWPSQLCAVAVRRAPAPVHDTLLQIYSVSTSVKGERHTASAAAIVMSNLTSLCSSSYSG